MCNFVSYTSIIYKSELFNILSIFFLLVRGMMYYRKALDLQCVLETAGDSG